MVTLHLVSLPHTETTPDYVTCAYSMKVVKFCQMMQGRGRRIVLYGGEENTAPCDEFVSLVSKEEREAWFGPWNLQALFPNLTWDAQHVSWRTMNTRAILEIGKRAEPHDLILLTAGSSQQLIAQAFPHLMAVEWAVGYEGIYTDKCAFESQAWMHHIYGQRGIINGRWYDCVIPNFFDPTEFQTSDPSPYLLYLGRITARKGPHVAAAIAQQLGRILIVAGPGATEVSKLDGGGTRIVGEAVTVEGPHVHYVGAVGQAERADLLAHAACVLMPTLYIEPFGGVAVEAMLSGTPVVASDFGAFTETIQEGVSGYRFRTLAEGCQAVEWALALSRSGVRDYALVRYTLGVVAPQFSRWFDRLEGLWGDGWTAPYGKTEAEACRS